MLNSYANVYARDIFPPSYVISDNFITMGFFIICFLEASVFLACGGCLKNGPGWRVVLSCERRF